MRGVVAKRLRKRARELTVGMPYRQLLAVYTIKKVKVTNPKHKDFGKTISVKMQSAVNDPQSFRGVYRAIKKLVKHGGRSFSSTPASRLSLRQKTIEKVRRCLY